MPQTIPEMIVTINRLRNQIEREVVDELAVKPLVAIFDRAERELWKQRRLFLGLDVTPQGTIKQSVKNLEASIKITDDLQSEINRWIVRPGRRWTDRVLPILDDAGRALARANLDVDLISQDLVDEVFRHIPNTERAVLRVGKTELYHIMGTVGTDVQDWFRFEMLDAITKGLPVQGAGSLAQRLFESGRLRPIMVRTEKGRLIRRSLRQRANAIARVESAKIINAVHDSLGEKALGPDRVGLNSNPRDSRTTDICLRASRQPPMTKQEWIASPLGLPPRLRPFHWCRSVIIWGEPDWFDTEDEKLS